jgi:hypothetical protein
MVINAVPSAFRMNVFAAKMTDGSSAPWGIVLRKAALVVRETHQKATEASEAS